MARKQSDYLADLLADESDAPSPAPAVEAPSVAPARATSLCWTANPRSPA